MNPFHRTAGVVVPAHNEERGLQRLLPMLATPAQDLEITVVCNGCTDDSVSMAKSFGPGVRVLELTDASKQAALRAGDLATAAFPRIYVDADVAISAASIGALARALLDPNLMAVGPSRRIPRTGCAWAVRRYYDVWERLPSVRRGLFGRGVIALSEAGYKRIGLLPKVIADDLAISEAFSDHERAIIADAEVVVFPPQTLADLFRRRARALRGNREADAAGLRAQHTRTRTADLLAILREDPGLFPGILVFAAVTITARLSGLRRGGAQQRWERDDSSRR